MGLPDMKQEEKEKKLETVITRQVEDTSHKVTTVYENPLYESSDREFVNPLYKGDELLEQHLPEKTLPVELGNQSAKKMSFKQRRKLKKKQKKEKKQQAAEAERERLRQEEEARLEMKQAFDEEVEELAAWAKEYEAEMQRTGKYWKFTGEVDRLLEDKEYGRLIEARANLSESAKTSQQRRLTFNKTHPNHTGGSTLARDATEYIGIGTSDTVLQQAIEDLLLMESKDADPQQLAAAKQRVAAHHQGYYDRVHAMMDATNIDFDAPIICKEEVLLRACKVADIFRFVQVGNYLATKLGGLVPLEQRAYIASVYELSKELTKAASGAFGTGSFVTPGVVEDQIRTGELTFSAILARRTGFLRERDPQPNG